VQLTLPQRLKAHPRRGHIRGGRLGRHGVLTVNAAGKRRITATLSRGAFSGTLGKKRTFLLRTVDVTGHPERQRIKARR
jgi:SLT domain-containing protein